MSISKRYAKKKGICKVTFEVPQSGSEDIQKVHVVGEFNDWSTTATPMKRSKKGIFSVSLDLEQGRQYQFRYLYNGQHWENEEEADGVADTPYGDAHNSVIMV